MSYQTAAAHLDALGVDAMKSLKPSLHRIEALCGALNHPEKSVPAIHVAGTNGKTSTARIASSLLAASGLSVGTYTSPHLQSVRERIALNGEPIDEGPFGDAFDHLSPYLELVEEELGERLSYFEVLTGMFFLWAADTPVDAVVVEVGLGGRWDATNVLPSSTAILTNVTIDHASLLGVDRPTIAREKVGIVKDGAAVVTGERSPEILAILQEEASRKGAQVKAIDRDFRLVDNRVAVGGRYVSVWSGDAEHEHLYLPLHGAHQGVNASVALEAVSTFTALPFSHELIAEGFAKTVVPGRLETVRLEERGATIVLDVAHNPDGASALVSSMNEAFAFERVVFVVGILADKDHAGMLAEFARIPCVLVTTAADSVRSMDPQVLANEAKELGLEATAVLGVIPAIERALSEATTGDLICITGSHYVVGEARTHLLAPSTL